MAIKRISVSNFKSFDELRVDLGRLNTLIGANASGKSNFIQIFRFLRDSMQFGLDDAISMHGGLEYLTNTNIGSNREISFEIVTDVSMAPVGTPIPDLEKEEIVFTPSESTYKLSIKVSRGQKRFQITQDALFQKGNFYSESGRNRKGKEEELIGEGGISVSRVNDELKTESRLPKQLESKEDDIFQIFLTKRVLEKLKLSRNELIIGLPYFRFMGAGAQFNLQNISVYDFDPKLSKKPQTITGARELEEDGSNLAAVLNNLLRSRRNVRKLNNLITDLLPFVSSMKIEKLASTIFLKLRETYSGNQFFPAFLISDGTINLTALIVALYFEGKDITVIEEPERNIHPYLISKIVDMMKDASRRTQIITTTHNPEILRYVDPEDILLVSRTNRGYSRISRPAEREEIKIFLQNEMGMPELYVQNLLEV